MEREEFLAKLGVGALAACIGCGLVSCSKGGNTPASTTNNAYAPASGTTITADLNNSLTAIGDSKISNGIILVRIATGNTPGSFTAVQSACTHEGFMVTYNISRGLFYCPLHGSEYNKNGGVTSGPATKALSQYVIAISNNLLTVTT